MSDAISRNQTPPSNESLDSWVNQPAVVAAATYCYGSFRGRLNQSVARLPRRLVEQVVDTCRSLRIDNHMPADYPIADLPTPDPSYGPGEVVNIQLDRLAANDNPFENAGIATAYNFASPANRRVTGPFDQFVRMVTGAQYAPMVDHVEATAGPVERDSGSAQQRVTLTGPDGRTATYVFGLSSERAGHRDGCWLTDRVLLE